MKPLMAPLTLIVTVRLWRTDAEHVAEAIEDAARPLLVRGETLYMDWYDSTEDEKDG